LLSEIEENVFFEMASGISSLTEILTKLLHYKCSSIGELSEGAIK